MLSKASVITSFVIFALFIAGPAHPTDYVYPWRDANGSIAFSDDPSIAPSNARVRVVSYDSDPVEKDDTGSTESASQNVAQPSSRTVTEGEFAIQLVRELGLGDPINAAQAAEILTSVRIAPMLGRWELDRPMTPEFTTRLRTLTVAAAQMGWIHLTPEQVLIAFDTTAALLGVPIHVTTEPDAIDYSEPVVEVPPVVTLFAPPVDFYPYYIWVPVAGGFWWFGQFCDGFFVLNNFRFNFLVFNDHRFVFNGRSIQRPFIRHIVDRRVVRNPEFRHSVTAPGHRSAGIPRAGSRPILNPPTQFRVRPSELPRSRIRSESPAAFHRVPGPRPTIHRAPAPSRFIGSKPMGRPMSRTLPSRFAGNPSFSIPRIASSGMMPHASGGGHGFGNAQHLSGFGRSGGFRSFHQR